jgi:hypothetical protein
MIEELFLDKNYLFLGGDRGKKILVSNPVNVGFRNSFFAVIFGDTYKMVRPMESFLIVKIYPQCR